MKKKPSIIQIFSLILIIVITSFICSKSCEDDRTSEQKEIDACGGGFNAFVQSKEFVKGKLKLPASAVFEEEYSYHYQGNCIFLVWGYVTSQNSFGAMLRSKYVVTLQKDSTGYRLIDFELQER